MVNMTRTKRALKSLDCNKLIVIEPLKRAAHVGKCWHYQGKCKFRLVKQLNNVINFITTSVFKHWTEHCYVFQLLFQNKS